MSARLRALAPLLLAYAALTALYVWQGTRRDTPTIFTDELELTQLSRAIAETGEPARRGEPYGFSTLAPWLTAPFWWIGSVNAAFEAIKAFQAVVMAAAMFPAYALARIAVVPRWALFAAVATGAAPALSYAPILVEEPFAYPAAGLALWLLVRAAAQPTWRAFALAAAGCLLATAVRSQLAVLFVILVATLAALGWRTGRMRAFRARWTAWDWTGAGVLALGAVVVASAAFAHFSKEWSDTSIVFRGRLVEYGVWAAGAFAIGVGILPLVATIAVVLRGPREHPGQRAYALVAGISLLAFAWYAAIKGAYLSTVFSSLVVERNLIYLTPVVMTGLAVLLATRSARWWGVLAGGGIALWLVTSTPTKIDQYPYYEAHGLSILSLANREWSWPNTRIETALLWITVGATLVVLLVVALRRRERAALGVAVGVIVAVLAWNLTNQIYAANGEKQFSDNVMKNLPRPLDWIDQAVDDGSVTALGQQITDPTGVWLAEFWNRSLTKVWSVDGSGPGPGPTLTPDLGSSDGSLTPAPETDFAMPFNGVALQGEEVARIGTTAIVRLDGGPLKVTENRTGIYSDGWMGANAAYNRYDVERDPPGFAKVSLARTAWCGTNVPGNATVRIGPIVRGEDKQPAIGVVTDEKTAVVNACQGVVLLLRAPREPWRVEVAIDPTFVPKELDPNVGDVRELGAQAQFDFVPVGS